MCNGESDHERTTGSNILFGSTNTDSNTEFTRRLVGVRRVVAADFIF
jgi:hypothetical protein